MNRIVRFTVAGAASELAISRTELPVSLGGKSYHRSTQYGANDTKELEKVHAGLFRCDHSALLDAITETPCAGQTNIDGAAHVFVKMRFKV